MDILTQKQDGVLTLSFNRPQKKNAITAAMYLALAQALGEAERNPQVRAIVFHGSDSIFTAGNDLEDFMKNPPADQGAPVFQFLLQLTRASKPLIAAVNGLAVGIGTTMLLHCDLVYVGENAKFSMPFVALGLCPESASSLLLPAIAGYQRAAEKLLLAEPFGATEAFEMGFVNKVLPDAEVLNHALLQARKLATLPVASLRTTKDLLKRGFRAQMEEQMREESDRFRRLLIAPEAKEAFAAFAEKRKPDFSKLA